MVAPAEASGPKAPVATAPVEAPRIAAVAAGGKDLNPIKNDFGEVEFGVGKKTFNLVTGGILTVRAAPVAEGTKDIMGKPVPKGSLFITTYVTDPVVGMAGSGGFAEPGKPYTVDFQGESITLTPRLVPDPNDFGEVDLRGGSIRELTLSSGRTVALSLIENPAAEPNDEPESEADDTEIRQYLIHMDISAGNDPADHGEDVGASVGLGEAFFYDLPDGEAFRFMPKF